MDSLSCFLFIFSSSAVSNERERQVQLCRGQNVSWEKIGFLQSVNNIYKANYIAAFPTNKQLASFFFQLPHYSCRCCCSCYCYWRCRYAFRKRFNNNHVTAAGWNRHIYQKANSCEHCINVSPQRNKFQQFFVLLFRNALATPQTNRIFTAPSFISIKFNFVGRHIITM